MSETNASSPQAVQQPAQPVPPRRVGVLLGIGILFMPYLFGWLTLRKGHTSTARIVTFGWLGVVAIALATSDKGGNRHPSRSAAVGATPEQSVEREEPIQQEQIRWIPNSCSEVARQWGMGSELTELQKKDLWDRANVAGMHFKWNLKVTSVDSTFGKLQAQFKCENSQAFASDMILGVSNKEIALRLTKGRSYTVHGILEDWGNFVGLQGELIGIE